MPTLSLECSKKLHALLGDTYETKLAWFNNDGEMGMALGWELVSFGWARETKGYEWHPSPSFGELIRLLPKIARKKGLRPHNEYMEDEEPMQDHLAKEIAVLMMDAPTEGEGMAKVSEYLEKVL